MTKLILSFILILACAICSSQTCLPITTVHAPFVYNNVNGITISGYRIKNTSGPCIRLTNCQNITINNCLLGPSSEEAIQLDNCHNITIIDCCFMDNKSGVYAHLSQGVKVNHNQFLNVLGPFPRGQFVQFANGYGAGNEVNDNVGENIAGESYPEDLVNMYFTNGDALSPIQIKRNKFRGGGPSPSGGGIMTGDGGGSYVDATDNILVDPGQYGIAIAGGNHIQLLNNKVYGRQQSFSNVGMYVWNQYPPACNTHTVENNEVNYIKSTGVQSSFWDGSNCGAIAGVSNNNWNAGFGEEILPERLLCPMLMTHSNFNNTWSTEGGVFTLTGNATFDCDGDQVCASFNGSHIETFPFSPWLKPTSHKFTVSCWIKPSTVQGIQGITRSEDGDGWNDGWRLLMINSTLNGRIVTSQGAFDVYCAGIQANVWNHVVMTYDGKHLKSYINGTLQGNVAATGKILYKTPNTLNMIIGYSDGDNYYYHGKIDEFKFYNGELTEAEILQDFNTTAPLINTPGTLVLNTYYSNNSSPMALYTTPSYENVAPGELIIYADPATPSTYVTYTWNVISSYGSSTFYSSASTAYLQMQSADVIELSVTGTSSCGSYTKYMSFDASLSGRFEVYPNPATSEIIVRANGQTSGRVSLSSSDISAGNKSRVTSAADSGKSFRAELYNSTGQRVLVSGSLANTLHLDVRTLPPGMYYLTLLNGETKVTKKVLIKR